jgi:formate hydrogenlyase subunit 6/NADH:ubiquinone oxidoreductase subunit I
MKIIVIDDVLCIKCRDCADICPENLFYSPPTKIGDKRQVSFKDLDRKCTFCGQCIDICPTQAINYQDKD